MKTCIVCKEEKEFDAFGKNKHSKDGYDCRCKVCRKEIRKRYNKPEYNSKRKEYFKEYHRGNDYRKGYYEKNKEKLLEKAKQYNKLRYHTNETYRLHMKMRNQLNKWLAGVTKELRTKAYFGYDANVLYSVLKNEIDYFKSIGIPYEVDHCIPVTYFEEGTPLSIISHIDNLKVISAKENGEKLHYYPTPPRNGTFLELAKQYIKPEYLCW